MFNNINVLYKAFDQLKKEDKKLNYIYEPRAPKEDENWKRHFYFFELKRDFQQDLTEYCFSPYLQPLYQEQREDKNIMKYYIPNKLGHFDYIKKLYKSKSELSFFAKKKFRSKYHNKKNLTFLCKFYNSKNKKNNLKQRQPKSPVSVINSKLQITARNPPKKIFESKTVDIDMGKKEDSFIYDPYGNNYLINLNSDTVRNVNKVVSSIEQTPEMKNKKPTWWMTTDLNGYIDNNCNKQNNSKDDNKENSEKDNKIEEINKDNMKEKNEDNNIIKINNLINKKDNNNNPINNSGNENNNQTKIKLKKCSFKNISNIPVNNKKLFNSMSKNISQLKRKLPFSRKKSACFSLYPKEIPYRMFIRPKSLSNNKLRHINKK